MFSCHTNVVTLIKPCYQFAGLPPLPSSTHLQTTRRFVTPLARNHLECASPFVLTLHCPSSRLFRCDDVRLLGNYFSNMEVRAELVNTMEVFPPSTGDVCNQNWEHCPLSTSFRTNSTTTGLARQSPDSLASRHTDETCIFRSALTLLSNRHLHPQDCFFCWC